MDVRVADPHEEAVMQRVTEDLAEFLSERVPTEEDYPGIKSLVVYALIAVAAQILSRCPASHRGAALESYQQYLFQATHAYGQARDAQQGG